MNVRLSFNVALACLALAAPGMAQGMTEFGSLMAGQGKPSGAVVNAVNQTYGNATKSINNSLQARPQIDFATAASYAKQANGYCLSAKQYLKQGKRSDAIREYTNALTVRERVWGDSDPAVAALLRQQAQLYRQEGQLHECEADYRKLLAIDIKRYGSGSEQLDAEISNLAELCERQSNNRDALGFYQELVAIRQRHDQPGCAQIKNARLKLANALTVSSDYPSAEAIFKTAISEEQANPAPDKAYLSKVLDSYGGMLRQADRNDEAQKVEARQHELQVSLSPATATASDAHPATTTTGATEPTVNTSATSTGGDSSPAVLRSSHK